MRFASVNQEIEPENTSALLDAGHSNDEHAISHDDATIKELTQTLQGSRLQERRMSNFAFEPVSLPVSRVRSLYFVFGPPGIFILGCNGHNSSFGSKDSSH